MATLVSVNVGLPKDVAWQGHTVYTGIWKQPVDGPRMVRRLNVDGVCIETGIASATRSSRLPSRASLASALACALANRTCLRCSSRTTVPASTCG